MGTIFILFTIPFICSSQVKLPALFSDNMVLQRQSKVSIWGWSAPEKRITISTSWNNAQYHVEADNKGKWESLIITTEAGGPYEILVNDGTPVIIKNVMLGEVWLCSGQSNMDMPMKGFRGQPLINSNQTILLSRNNNIRCIKVPRASKTEPQENFNGTWQVASPETVAEYSATAYYFGKLIQEVLDIPVGLIDVSWGGSCIQAWMSKNTAVPFEDKKVPGPRDSISVENRTPTLLFNGMVNPVIGYGIKGCIWYQGETNYKEADHYKWMLATMVNEWRSLWEIGDFPFYYAQIAPYGYGRFTPEDNNPKLNSAYIREAQMKAQDTIPNSGMVVLLDIGEENNIHPMNKEITGTRFAYWALGHTYGIKGIGYASPAYKAMEIKDSTVIISFENVPNGITSFGKEVKNFEVAGTDKVFHAARAVVRSKSVVVFSPQVKQPVAVRYAFKDFVTGDLFGNDGIPVSSFRTDNW